MRRLANVRFISLTLPKEVLLRKAPASEEAGREEALLTISAAVLVDVIGIALAG